MKLTWTDAVYALYWAIFLVIVALIVWAALQP